jgi:transposase
MVQRIDVTLEGLHQLHQRIERQQLDPGDWTLVGVLVSRFIARTEATRARMLAKLAAEADKKAAADASGPVIDAEYTAQDGEESQSASSSDANAISGGGAAESLDGTPTEANGSGEPAPAPKKKAKGHGRNGVGAYTNAKHFFHELVLGVIGALCVCGAGRMSRYREKSIIRIVGQPIFGAEIHHFAQAWCKLCGRIITAAGSASVLEGIGTSYITYDWSACAMLMVMHYFGGAPFKRIESLHAGWGVPMSDANQWNLVDQGDEMILPLYNALELYGIRNAINLRIDDTGAKVITIMRQIQAEVAALQIIGESTKDVRTGINATGVHLETKDGTIILFYTGRHHAGEIIDRLLKHRRASSPKLPKVTDAASKNFDHDQEDKLIDATCNAHCFLTFRAIKDKFPAEYAFVAEIYKKVFDNDDKAKALVLTPEERMLYHRKHSKPLMEKLKAWCEEKIKSNLVEPRSPLWAPLTYVINQFSRLTKFYEEPGVPLDTNLVEQDLIIPVRYLAGSFFYKTENGAEVGDRAMSFILTARANGVEPVAYLADCLRNHEDLAKRPEYYLPWVYRERLKDAAPQRC